LKTINDFAIDKLKKNTENVNISHKFTVLGQQTKAKEYQSEKCYQTVHVLTNDSKTTLRSFDRNLWISWIKSFVQ